MKSKIVLLFFAFINITFAQVEIIDGSLWGSISEIEKSIRYYETVHGGDYRINTDLGLAAQIWFTSPWETNFTRFDERGADGVNIYDTTTRSWYWLDKYDYLNDGFSLKPISRPRSGNPSTMHTSLLNFYRRLPKLKANLVDYNKGLFHTLPVYKRKRTDSQTYLYNYLARFKKNVIAKDPFIRAGLKYVKRIVLVENQYSSPSQYDVLRNVIYINKADLKDFGYTVLFHELLQAGLINAYNKKLISRRDYKALRNLGRRRFPKYFGYIGGLLKSNITDFKAFAIGYTYRKLRNNLYKLPSIEKEKAKEFLSHVRNNVKVTSLELNTDFTLPTSINLRMIDSTANWKERTKSFVNRFMNSSSDIVKEINAVRLKIKNRL